MTEPASHAQAPPTHCIKEKGGLYWPTCPSQWMGPSDAHPAFPHGQEMGGDGKTCQTDKNTSLSPFATRFEGRTRRTPTFKGCTELEKENKGYEGSLGEARSLREESSSTRREWPKANSRRSDRLPLFRVPITHPHLDQRGCEPWLGHCRFCHHPQQSLFPSLRNEDINRTPAP